MARSKTAGDLNAMLLKELLEARADATKARAKAEMADAKATMVRAKIEAAGKQIKYDWNDGIETLSVVDVVIS
jgi:hypothetical protein